MVNTGKRKKLLDLSTLTDLNILVDVNYVVGQFVMKNAENHHIIFQVVEILLFFKFDFPHVLFFLECTITKTRKITNLNIKKILQLYEVVAIFRLMYYKYVDEAKYRQIQELISHQKEK